MKSRKLLSAKKVRVVLRALIPAIMIVACFSSPQIAGGDERTSIFEFQTGAADPGFNLLASDEGGVELVHTVTAISLTEISSGGRQYAVVGCPGAFLPAEAGTPDLPAFSRFVAVPRGAEIEVEILELESVTLEGVTVAPAGRLPLANDDTDVPLLENQLIYDRDLAWPEQPVRLSGPMELRGVQVRLLGIIPFAYHPVSSRLTVFTEMRVRIRFQGGDGSFVEPRLRSRWWDPVLRQHLLNFTEIDSGTGPETNFAVQDGAEYLILTPDDPDFIAWGETLAHFRRQQGISTEVVPVSLIGGNTVEAIETFIDTAYQTWDTPPVAVLFLGDYVPPGEEGGLTSPSFEHPDPLSDTYVSDNAYADVNGDHLPDLITARITARDAGELSVMISKILGHERNPPADPGFYDHPVLACGYQYNRWFQLSSEIIFGFWTNELGKNPVRQYDISSGTPVPGGAWSTNINTPMVVEYFGQAGQGYIPDTLPDLDWENGSAGGINGAVNSGAFFLQHRDHGGEDRWGEPRYTTADLAGLSNTMLPWVVSVNCLSGRFNSNIEVLVEAFHRMPGGALGATGESEISYSFVNDAYVYGLYDALWPRFDPGYPAQEPAGEGLLMPAFADASAKYYLQASGWPYNPQYKELTFDLIHTHADPFLSLCTEVPGDLQVVHAPALPAMTPAFPVNAPEGSLVALTRNGEILAVAEGTGSEVEIPIPPQSLEPSPVRLTVTGPNFRRYETDLPVIPPPQGPYVAYDVHQWVDDGSGGSAGNGDGIASPGEILSLQLLLRNLGVTAADGVTANLSSPSGQVIFQDHTAWYGDLAPDQAGTNLDPLVVEIAGTCPDQEMIRIDISCTDGEAVWDSAFFITVVAARYTLIGHEISDTPAGNGNGSADMGETVLMALLLHNNGPVKGTEIEIFLPAEVEYGVIPVNQLSCPDLEPGVESSTVQPHLQIYLDPAAPCGAPVVLPVEIRSRQGTSFGQVNLQLGARETIFLDEAEEGEGDWVHWADQGVDDWRIVQTGSAHSRFHAWFCSAVESVKDDYLESPVISLQPWSSLEFWHRYNLEFDYDGCVIEISDDSGGWIDLGPWISEGGYDRTIYTLYSPISGREAWTGDSGSVMSRVTVDLSPFAGTSRNIRFRLACDRSQGGGGWYLDDILVSGLFCEPHDPGVGTIAVDLRCSPATGTLPLDASLTVYLMNLTDSSRSLAGRLDLLIPTGELISGYREGNVVLAPREMALRSWRQHLPSHAYLHGDNVFTLTGEDVTPAPFNQAPYPPSGDTGTMDCTLGAAMPSQ